MNLVAIPFLRSIRFLLAYPESEEARNLSVYKEWAKRIDRIIDCFRFAINVLYFSGIVCLIVTSKETTEVVGGFRWIFNDYLIDGRWIFAIKNVFQNEPFLLFPF